MSKQIPHFSKILFDIYTIYHTNKTTQKSYSKLTEVLMSRYSIEKDIIFPDYDDVVYNCNSYRQTFYFIVHTFKNVLGKLELLKEYDTTLTEQLFTIHYLRKYKFYSLALLEQLLIFHGYDGLECIERISYDYDTLNEILYDEQQDELLMGFKNDLLKLINYSFVENETRQKNQSEQQSNIRQDLLNKLKQLSPTAFEHFALHLVAVISKEKDDDIKNLITHNGQVGDGGIDGIINIKTPLGNYDKYFIQCKRYDKGTIGRPEVQTFVGSMVGYEATKGIFITTSTFTANALEYVNNLKTYSVQTMNGSDLVDYMLNHNIGVISKTYQEIDTPFFEMFN